MTIWNVDILWGLMLFGVALWTTCCLVFNPILRSIGIMGIGTAYAIGAWMAITLPWVVALTTWCVFAAFGGAISLGYELWARHHYAGTGRKPRPLILIQGFLLWPTMIPQALEGMLVDAGVLKPSGGARHAVSGSTSAIESGIGG
jgi:hypothetical protein